MRVVQNFQKFGVLAWTYYVQNYFQELQVPYRTHRSSGRVQNMMYPFPGYCGTSQTEFTEVPGRGMGYGYENLTEVPEVPGMGMRVLRNFQNFRVLWHGRPELPDVRGRSKHAVPVPLLFVAPSYRTSESFGYGYENLTEVPDVPGTGMKVLRNSAEFSGIVARASRTSRRSW